MINRIDGEHISFFPQRVNHSTCRLSFVGNKFKYGYPFIYNKIIRAVIQGEVQQSYVLQIKLHGNDC